jgi:hypothetical protein
MSTIDMRVCDVQSAIAAFDVKLHYLTVQSDLAQAKKTDARKRRFQVPVSLLPRDQFQGVETPLLI